MNASEQVKIQNASQQRTGIVFVSEWRQTKASHHDRAFVIKHKFFESAFKGMQHQLSQKDCFLKLEFKMKREKTFEFPNTDQASETNSKAIHAI